MKIFRKTRQKFIIDKKITNYILYAIGEVFLVMTGILLALYVSNWNDVRMQRNELTGILKTIALDLERDTLVGSGLIKFYTENEKISLKIINKEISFENYKDCPSCTSLVSIYKPFNIQTKGYDLVKNFSNQNNQKNDTLVTNITQFYTSLSELIKDSNKFIKDEVFSNINSFKEHSWFIDWTQGNYSKEMIIYFTESEDYRKRVASHNLLAAKNHLLFITIYNNGAKAILKKINERFKNEL